MRLVSFTVVDNWRTSGLRNVDNTYVVTIIGQCALLFTKFFAMNRKPLKTCKIL